MPRPRATLALLLSPFVIGHSSFAADEIDGGTPLEFGSFTAYTENDKYFAGTDEHYTNGFKFSALSADLSNQLRFLDGLVGGDHPRKLGLSVGQNIYTPEDTQATALIPNDRPYAAWLYVGASFQVYRPPATEGGLARLDVFEVTAGVVGPAALGREVQNGFHRLIDVEEAQGWDNQIKNEPGLNLVYERKYRFATRNARTGWGADFIPHAGVSLGNIFTYANAGFEVRAGHALPADFGSNLIRASGDSNALARRPFSLFLFAAVDGRAVARDITLDGNTFRDSADIDKKHFVADLYAGLGLGTTHWQLTYAQAYRTLEFRGQDARSVFGSISLSFFY
jgi:lipid A 3-O-deacylase